VPRFYPQELKGQRAFRHLSPPYRIKNRCINLISNATTDELLQELVNLKR
jgi:hypothetical protein